VWKIFDTSLPSCVEWKGFMDNQFAVLSWWEHQASLSLIQQQLEMVVKLSSCKGYWREIRNYLDDLNIK